LYHKQTIFLLPFHYTTIFFVIDSLTIFTAQIVRSLEWRIQTRRFGEVI